MAKAKAIVYRQNIEVNTYIYYDSAEVLSEWKNTNKNTYYQTANTYQKYWDTFGNNYKASPRTYGLYFSGDAYSKVKLLYNYNIGMGSTFAGQQAPIRKSEKSWSTHTDVLTSYFLDFNGYATLEFLRLNSNIYKNIFPETVSDMEYINKIISETPTSTESLSQLNHGLQIGDVVYLDDDGLYKKALAENSNKSNVAGIVSKVNSLNTFTLMNTGKIDYQHLDYTDTSILYLSDKIPGKLVHYSNIDNMTYIPVAMYADNKIIVNIQQGSTGDYLAPYEQEITNFDPYEQQDLDDIISQIKGGVLSAK